MNIRVFNQTSSSRYHDQDKFVLSTCHYIRCRGNKDPDFGLWGALHGVVFGQQCSIHALLHILASMSTFFSTPGGISGIFRIAPFGILRDLGRLSRMVSISFRIPTTNLFRSASLVSGGGFYHISDTEIGRQTWYRSRSSMRNGPKSLRFPTVWSAIVSMGGLFGKVAE